MRISDWSSDVCSSDLRFRPQAPVLQLDEHHRRILATTGNVEASYRENGLDIVFFLFSEIAGDLVDKNLGPLGGGTRRGLPLALHAIGRATSRDSGGQSVYISGFDVPYTKKY